MFISFTESESCPPIVDGIPYIRWVHTLFGDCVYTSRECLSVMLGYFSILCWLNAQIPQIIKNYRLQNAESLSFPFLAIWLIGDIGNFIGCILTGQLDFQLYLAVYFTIVDATLCCQWLYYVKYSDNWLRRTLSPSGTETTRLAVDDDEQQLIPGYQSTSSQSPARTLLAIAGFVPLRMSPEHQTLSFATSQDIGAWASSGSGSGKGNLWIGRSFAWLCAFLYLASRVPQIIRNFHRRSAEGLSMTLFLCAAVGNLTYTLGIFANPHQTSQSLLEAVPYILGSGGTLVFDLTIYCQYLYYNRSTEEKKRRHSAASIA